MSDVLNVLDRLPWHITRYCWLNWIIYPTVADVAYYAVGGKVPIHRRIITRTATFDALLAAISHGDSTANSPFSDYLQETGEPEWLWQVARDIEPYILPRDVK